MLTHGNLGYMAAMSETRIEMFSKAGRKGSEHFPRKSDKTILYGTAGFRTRAAELEHIAFRMGLLAVLRSKAKEGSTIGLMLTASHNPAPDNGVKLIDPCGEMLEQSWEKFATRLANASDGDVPNILTGIVKEENINMDTTSHVHIGQDTRPSSPALAQAAIEGIKVLEGTVTNFGVVTTPMLHYFVLCSNTKGDYGEPTEEGYFKKLSTAFERLFGENAVNGNYEPNIYFDGANGVGAVKMKSLLPYIPNTLQVSIYNDGNGKLNHFCGADYVKVEQAPANGIPQKPGVRCLSVDGDADRIVYYFCDAGGKFHLLDGDRIATLVAGYLMQLVQESKLNLQLGLVQTAYANGGSTNYISNVLMVPVVCVPTGVKHLHHKAQEFDIGVYFEANGHGTVVFSKSAIHQIKESIRDDSATAEKTARERLAAVVDVINQTVGDAISDMLLVEVVLQARGWNLSDWEATYHDLPNRQLKVMVKDRTVIETTDAERKCVAPAGLQDRINELVSNIPLGRSFVRPSGTEDIVRVYAEADIQENADKLANQVAAAVFELASGVGTIPNVPV